MTSTVLVFLSRELRESRRDSQFWAGHGILGLLAIAFPTIVVFACPAMMAEAARGDTDVTAILSMVNKVPEFAAYEPVEGLTRYLLRTMGAFYLLMATTTSAMAAAFSIVGEKQSRTLEPILATPISDRELLWAKMVAVVLPSIVTTWSAGVLGAILADIFGWRQFHRILLPDPFWAAALFLLAPLAGICAALLAMRVSARMTSVQGASQFTGLIVIPGLMILIALLGKTLTVSFPAVLAAALFLALYALWLFRRNRRKFEREEILTRWK